MAKLKAAWGKLLDWLRDERNVHLSSWIQTVAIVAGIVFGVLELQQVGRSFAASQNRELQAYYETNRRQFSEPVQRLINLAYQADESFMTESRFDSVMAELNPDSLLREFGLLLRDVEDCGELDVCPRSGTRRFVCQQSKDLYSAFEQPVPFAAWEDLEPWRHSTGATFMINRNCGLINRLLFYYVWPDA